MSSWHDGCKESKRPGVQKKGEGAVTERNSTYLKFKNRWNEIDKIELRRVAALGGGITWGFGGIGNTLCFLNLGFGYRGMLTL